jgi:DNA-binding transcriptional ArsR family regulator
MTYISTLNALSDGTRRAILEKIAVGACGVGEIAAVIPVSQPAVSQHLRVLKEAGLVRVRKKGTRRIYSLAPDGLVELRAYFDSMWGDVLTAFKEAAEDLAEGERS